MVRADVVNRNPDGRRRSVRYRLTLVLVHTERLVHKLETLSDERASEQCPRPDLEAKTAGQIR